MSWTDGQTDRGKTVYPPPPSGSGGIITANAAKGDEEGEDYRNTWLTQMEHCIPSFHKQMHENIL